MKIEVKKYNLPDLYPLLTGEESEQFYTWIPESRYIILGRSNNPESSLIEENVIEDKVEVYQRPSGGEAVILTKNMLVISAVAIDKKIGSQKTVFEKFNKTIIGILEEIGVKELNQKGISDISIGEKKILGSSMYKVKDSYFYHAVLNVSEKVGLISRYLKHPGREPDYRKGRSHSEFVTSLENEGYSLVLQYLVNIMNERKINKFN